MSNTSFSKKNKIMCIGASPDSINKNAILRQFVVEGFDELIGPDNVVSTSLEDAYLTAINFKPDLILAFGSCMPDSSYYIAIKAYCVQNNVLFYFWLHDDPYEFDFHTKIIQYADLIFSNDRFASVHYPQIGATHLPLGCSKKHHYREIVEEADMKYDVFFCGVAFENRKKLIRYLHPMLKNLKTYIVGPGWETMGIPYCHGGSISNSDFSDLVSKSKYTLNIGRHLNLANNRFQLTPSTPGPRTFEAAMAGAVQLFFVESLEVLDYFENEKEILLFDSKKDFENLILEKSEYERRLIRKQAQEKSIAQHTYTKRVEIILSRIPIKTS